MEIIIMLIVACSVFGALIGIGNMFFINAIVTRIGRTEQMLPGIVDALETQAESCQLAVRTVQNVQSNVYSNCSELNDRADSIEEAIVFNNKQIIEALNGKQDVKVKKARKTIKKSTKKA